MLNVTVITTAHRSSVFQMLLHFCNDIVSRGGRDIHLGSLLFGLSQVFAGVPGFWAKRAAKPASSPQGAPIRGSNPANWPGLQ